METIVDEIADNIYRLSTFIDGAGPHGFTFNQFLIDAEEPLIFHTGGRAIFPLVSAAIERVMPLERLRWITFGHFEADECGAMNLFLAGAKDATVAQGQLGTMLSVADQADRSPRALDNGEVLDLGGKRVRYISTPHVPHGWDAGLLYEENTETLFAGDLFTLGGTYDAQTTRDLVEDAMDFEKAMPYTCLTPNTAKTIRTLAALRPKTLALMHNSAYHGDCERQLDDLAAAYQARLERKLAAV